MIRLGEDQLSSITDPGDLFMDIGRLILILENKVS